MRQRRYTYVYLGQDLDMISDWWKFRLRCITAFNRMVLTAVAREAELRNLG
jgi:hypothetical protein